MHQFEVKFKYADEMSHHEWRNQSCIVSADSAHQAIKECIKFYGLGIDCDYEIVDVENLEDANL